MENIKFTEWYKNKTVNIFPKKNNFHEIWVQDKFGGFTSTNCQGMIVCDATVSLGNGMVKISGKCYQRDFLYDGMCSIKKLAKLCQEYNIPTSKVTKNFRLFPWFFNPTLSLDCGYYVNISKMEENTLFFPINWVKIIKHTKETKQNKSTG